MLCKYYVCMYGFLKSVSLRNAVFMYNLHNTQDLHKDYIKITQEKELLKGAFMYIIHNILSLSLSLSPQPLHTHVNLTHENGRKI